MATLLLTAAVSQLGATGFAGAIFAGAAGALGGFIDNQLLFPLFSKDQRPRQLVGPRITDFQVQTASEGTPVPFSQGPSNRVAGNIIWQSPLKEVVRTETEQVGGGGKGGGGGAEVSTKTFTYFVSVAVAVGEGVIQNIDKIWADGLLLSKEDSDVDLAASTLLSATVIRIFSNGGTLPGNDSLLRTVKLRITSPNGGPDLSQFRSGKDVVMSGWSESQNNGTFRVLSSSIDTGTGISIMDVETNGVLPQIVGITQRNSVDFLDTNPDIVKLFFQPIILGIREPVNLAQFGFAGRIGGTLHINNTADDVNKGEFTIASVDGNQITIDGSESLTAALAINGGNYTAFFGKDEAAGASVTLSQEIDDFSTKDVKNITVHTGTDSQLPDSLIESFEGVGNVPGYVGIAYVVLEDIALDRFGKRIPNLSFLVKKDTSITVGDAVGERLERSGLVASDFDVSAITDDFKGMTTAGPQTGERELEPIITAFNLIVTESLGKLRFEKRDALTIFDIDDDDIASHVFGDNIRRRIVITKGDQVGLPQEVNVGYIDPVSDFQKGMQKQRKIENLVDSSVTFEIPITLSADEARNIAFRELWTAHSNNDIISLSLPPSYFFLEENDTIRFEGDENEQFVAVIKRIDRGINGLILIEALVESSTTLEHDAVEDSPFIVADPEIYIPPAMIFELLDIAPLFDDHVSIVGYYVATATAQFNKEFQGASLFSSKDTRRGPSRFKLVDTFTIEATMGNVVGVVDPGVLFIFDEATIITVELINGTLESKTELEVLEGVNLAFVGGEIIGFKNATLVGTNTYELTGLIRGLRNTEWFRTIHVDTEPFVLLDGPGIQFESIDLKDLDESISFKMVPSGAELDDTNEKIRSLYGRTIRPFFPVQINGIRDVNNNLSLTWTRRTRAFTKPITGGIDAPMIEPLEEYEVHILNVAGDTVLRIIEICGQTNTIYTEVDQIADGLTPGDPVTLIVYQISSTLSKELPTEGVIPLNLVSVIV